MIVVDASAVVELLFATPLGEIVWDRITEPEEEIAAPCLLDIEVTHVVRRYALTKAVDEARAARAVAHLGDFNAMRWPHEPLLPRIWTLRHNLSAYDAAYVTLADALDCPLLTCDRRLARTPVGGARIELVVA